MVVEKVDLQVKISKDVYDLLKDFSEWCGYRIEEYIERIIVGNIEADLSIMDIKFLPKQDEFWERVEEPKKVVFIDGTENESTSDQGDKMEVKISKELYGFLKEFCEWSGNEMENYIEYTIFDEIRMDLDYVRETPIPKGDEFWKRAEELKEKLNF